MPESGESGALASPTDPAVDPDAMIAALRRRGAEQIDPVRFRFIEALARRAQAYRGASRRRLDARLASALSEYRERFELAQNAAGDTLTCIAANFPEARDDSRRLFSAGDFRGLDRFAAALESHGDRSALADLVRHIAQTAADGVDDDGAGNAAPGADLKSVRYFRNTWSKLSVDQQLNRAIAQGPENAGPLNSHRLVLQSLELMRDLSPDYLNRFMSYADALLWLDQANGGSTPTDKNPARGESDKKRKPGRGRSR